MKTRIISAMVGTVLLFAVLLCPHLLVFDLVAAGLSMLAVWELLHNTGLMKHTFVSVVSMLFSALLVGACVLAQSVALNAREWNPMPADALLPLIGILVAVYAAFMLVAWLCCRKDMSFSKFGNAFILTLYATAGFASLAVLRLLSVDYFYFLLVLVIPWMSDIGAYFTGMLFGKHKMAPIISPKKTWEGFFGGWAISIGSAALFAVIGNACGVAQGEPFDPLAYAIIAAILAPISVLGDLLASRIKRHFGIKDYGKLMPGHGGVMDRFDSVVMIAPLLYLANIFI